jgi:hypothetical protein
VTWIACHLRAIGQVFATVNKMLSPDTGRPNANACHGNAPIASANRREIKTLALTRDGPVNSSVPQPRPERSLPRVEYEQLATQREVMNDVSREHDAVRDPS